MKIYLVTVATVVVAVLTTACTDLKPLQLQVDELKTQVSRLDASVSGMKSATDAAATEAGKAGQAAASAQTAANQALAASQTSQTCCDATNEKIDRMFKRSVSK